MKKLLLLLTLFFALGAVGQQALVSNAFTTVSTGTSTFIGLSGITYHKLIWSISGTVTTCQLKVEQSSDGVTWSDLIPAQTCTSNGKTGIFTVQNNFVRLNMTTLSGGGTVNAVYAGFISATTDPCMDSSGVKSSVVVNIGSATTTAVVAAVAGQSIYICQFDMTIGGTNATVQFKAGTQVTNPCDTGTVLLTGTYSPTSGNEVSTSAASMLLKTTAGQQLCITSAGTGVNIQGLITYVQQVP